MQNDAGSFLVSLRFFCARHLCMTDFFTYMQHEIAVKVVCDDCTVGSLQLSAHDKRNRWVTSHQR